MLDIVFRSDSFFIQDLVEKPNKKGGGYALLCKIEEVLRRNLLYIAEESADYYAQLSQSDLYALLRRKAKTIVDTLHQKAAGICSCFFWNVGEGRKIEEVYRKISCPANGFFILPPEIQQYLCRSYLDWRSLGRVACVNRVGNLLVQNVLIQQAKAWGCDTNDPDQARARVKDFWGMRKFHDYLLPGVLVKDKKGVNIDATLEQCALLLSQKAEVLSIDRIRVLLADITRDSNMVRTFVAFGMDINIQDYFSGRTLLSYCVEYQDAKLVEFLLSKGANPEIPSGVGIYPLFHSLFHCARSNYTDLDALTRISWDEVDIISKRMTETWTFRDNKEITTLLLKAGAKFGHYHSLHMLKQAANPLVTSIKVCFGERAGSLLQLVQRSCTPTQFSLFLQDYPVL